VNIDYTGGLTLGCGVVISEGVKIFTHNHVVDFSGKDESKGCEKTPLIIQDRVWIGARAIIMPGVNEIGRGALISSCSYVRSKVPPYAVVMGNPAKIVAFRLLPKEIIEFEKEYYPESEQIPLEILEQNYNKYFIGRIKDIKEFVKQ
jgi:acetyltransferase-like isoleucine patch superfamily enzyme